MKHQSAKQKEDQEWNKLSVEEQNKVKEAVLEWRKQVLSSFKKTSEDIESKPAPSNGSKYEVKAALIWKFKQDEDIQYIPLPAICSAFNISVTYYNQLKSIHQYEWDDIFREHGKHNQVGNKNIGITT